MEGRTTCEGDYTTMTEETKEVSQPKVNSDVSAEENTRFSNILKQYGETHVNNALSNYHFKNALTDSGLTYWLENIDIGTFAKTRELQDAVQSLRKDIAEKAGELLQAKLSEKMKSKKISELELTIDQLIEKEKLSFLLSRVNEEARRLLLESEDFKKAFFDTNECNAFVMSVDIRRSTELMSKARSPKEFAAFMTILCKDLEMIIKDSYGVFDKFTGDGVLAFFPDFFSGKDGGYYAISSADRCHKIFEERYKEFRSSFISVLKDVGLGIGIDYGPAHLVQMAGGLTVVGAPVVYACRMSGAPAGTTLLNQPGYEKVSERFSAQCFFREPELNIKNEGVTLAYDVRLSMRDFVPSPPSWQRPAARASDA